jgi:hypothetical protein
MTKNLGLHWKTHTIIIAIIIFVLPIIMESPILSIYSLFAIISGIWAIGFEAILYLIRVEKNFNKQLTQSIPLPTIEAILEDLEKSPKHDSFVAKFRAKLKNYNNLEVQ